LPIDKQERIDTDDITTELAPRSPQTQHQIAEHERDRLRQDAHQHQLDQAQDGLEHRRAALEGL
jgi:hypothetical protein